MEYVKTKMNKWTILDMNINPRRDCMNILNEEDLKKICQSWFNKCWLREWYVQGTETDTIRDSENSYNKDLAFK